MVYIEGSQVLTLKTLLILANSVDPGEIPYYAAFHLGLHCLSKYLLWVFQNSKGLRRVRCTYFIQLKHLGQHMRFFCSS